MSSDNFSHLAALATMETEVDWRAEYAKLHAEYEKLKPLTEGALPWSHAFQHLVSVLGNQVAFETRQEADKDGLEYKAYDGTDSWADHGEWQVTPEAAVAALLRIKSKKKRKERDPEPEALDSAAATMELAAAAKEGDEP